MLRKLERGKPHQKYSLSGSVIPLPGCSWICKIGDSSDGLVSWSWKLGLEGKDYKIVRDEAAHSGTVAHALIEAYLNEYDLDLSDWPTLAIKEGELACKAFVRWWEKGEYRLISTETQLVSDEHLFGGTLDILAYNLEGKKCLIDLKRVKALRASHAIQVAGGYRLLVNETSDSPVDEVCLLKLPRGRGKASPLWLDPDNFKFYEECFLANLASYYARQRLEKAEPMWKWTPYKKK